ncbi:unnamed protein product [Miscanthus lutarioriparius]|uniref:Uncharacterized protein n=1 Tax=Miscanthus lutarioriparius TaxID=422564 RepID=A0A811PET8_9POAL|nr:unnamed protein product [Miscanthus lutarioriparius]
MDSEFVGTAKHAPASLHDILAYSTVDTSSKAGYEGSHDPSQECYMANIRDAGTLDPTRGMQPPPVQRTPEEQEAYLQEKAQCLWAKAIDPEKKQAQLEREQAGLGQRPETRLPRTSARNPAPEVQDQIILPRSPILPSSKSKRHRQGCYPL